MGTKGGPYTIAMLPGDGVGPEVTREALRVLHAVERRFQLRLDLCEALVGQASLKVNGVAITDETLAMCEQSDGILFGSVGGASVGRPDDPKTPENALYRLRKTFALFANLRPVRTYPALAGSTTLKRAVLRGVDLVVLRELTGGLYYGRPSEIRATPNGEEAIDTLIYTAAEIERVVRYAFELSRGRRKQLTSVDKANVLASSRLWRQVADRIAPEYPDVTLRHLFVDSCAMQLIRAPSSFDVIVTENMFGDILTDEASMLAGSLGMLPSASLGTKRTTHGQFGLYEPIHGTAPDIAGHGIANPIAAILSAALLLRHSLGLKREARAVERAVERAISAGYRTKDIASSGGKTVSTEEMGKAIVQYIEG